MKMKQFLGAVASVAMVSAPALAIEPGDTAPAFTLKNTDGDEVSLADYEGKTVVLEWTNYDCPFVKKHYTSGNLPDLQKQYTDKDVVWLVVNSAGESNGAYMEPADLGKRADKEGSNATEVLLDPTGETGKAYGATNTPQMYVISEDGKIAYMGAIDDKSGTEVDEIETANNHVVDALELIMADKPVAVAKTKPYGCSVKY